MRVLIAAVTALVLLAPVVGAETEASASYAGEVTATALRLRAGPGEAYQQVSLLRKGEKLIVLGQHVHNPSWLIVELPAGYKAWVTATFVTERPDGTGIVTVDRLLVRPRATTRYHQLSGGTLAKDAQVKIVARKKTEEGLWYEIEVPRSIPLFAHGDYIRNIGPASLAEPAPAPGAKGAVPLAMKGFAGDIKVRQMEPLVRKAIDTNAGTVELDKLRTSLEKIDRSTLSPDMREKRFVLFSDLLHAQRERSVEEIKVTKKGLERELQRELSAIEARYQRRLEEIRAKYERPKRKLFTATGIVKYNPDLFGKHPVFRLEEGGKMRYYLIATAFDLHKFKGKRVGVSGLKDAESGTGQYAIIVKRIEILGDN
ncbi:MAG: SH3 domain-containing protein [Planctomycetota bacterium]